jgi:hypothetical protein
MPEVCPFFKTALDVMRALTSILTDHPMKPFRIRMTDSLVLNYGLYKKMQVYVSEFLINSCIQIYLCANKRAMRATLNHFSRSWIKMPLLAKLHPAVATRTSFI